MQKIELYKLDACGEPTASFATDAEIEFAEKLRHQLEERYLAQSTASLPSSSRTNEVH